MSFSCRRASRLMSDAMNRTLSPTERVSLGFHLIICTYCRRFRAQIRYLRNLIQRYVQTHEADPTSSHRLSPDAKARIRHALGNRL
jgi:hypothetical protein